MHLVPLATLLIVLAGSLLNAEENQNAEDKKAAARAIVFLKWDKDHNGSLSPEEFRASPNSKDNQIFSRLDKDGNGALSQEEFVGLIPKKNQGNNSKKSPSGEESPVKE
jgi:Ca2+-binding EF-hand superfamily protein